jgi:hypothetical protein
MHDGIRTRARCALFLSIAFRANGRLGCERRDALIWIRASGWSRGPTSRRVADMRIRRLAAGAAVVVVTLFGFAGGSPASATVPSSQLVFIDSRGDVFSIFVYGTNQNSNFASHCWITLDRETVAAGWWWAQATVNHIEMYNGTDCSSRYLGTQSFVTSGATYSCHDDLTLRDYDC